MKMMNAGPHKSEEEAAWCQRGETNCSEYQRDDGEKGKAGHFWSKREESPGPRVPPFPCHFLLSDSPNPSKVLKDEKQRGGGERPSESSLPSSCAPFCPFLVPSSVAVLPLIHSSVPFLVSSVLSCRPPVDSALSLAVALSQQPIGGHLPFALDVDFSSELQLKAVEL